MRRPAPSVWILWMGHVGRPMESEIISSEQKDGARSPPVLERIVLSRTKSVDKEPHPLESQHSFLLCSPRNLFHPRLQAACRPSFNSRRRRSAPFVPCAILPLNFFRKQHR